MVKITVFAFWMLVLLVMLLIPPYIQKNPSAANTNFRGYGLLFSPPPPIDNLGRPIPEQSRYHFEISIDISRLAIQGIIVILLAALSYPAAALIDARLPRPHSR